MKSYFLEGVSSIGSAKSALSAELPGQEEPWVVRTEQGDVVAYLNVESELDGENKPHVVADMSGRDFAEDEMVVALLERLKLVVGVALSDEA